jgi:hypothetical protein
MAPGIERRAAGSARAHPRPGNVALAMHFIQCDCGAVKATVTPSGTVNRVICYCADCQAFARFLNRETDVLDEAGGTDIVQMAQKDVTFIQGTEYLACVRLTGKGLCRWYAGCCNTPIGNTHSNFRISLVGLIHNCVNPESGSLDDAFGPVRARAFTGKARTKPKPRATGLAGAAMRITGIILKNRLNGAYLQTPFFRTESGEPVTVPRVLSNQERDNLGSE